MMGQEHIRNIRLLSDTAIGAIFEPNKEMRSAAAELAPEAIIVDSIEELLAIDDIDCLVITSPNHTHIENLQKIASVRVLPVLVEKPLATDPADEATILDLQASYSAPIWVAMEYRYMPPLAEFIKRAHEVTGGITMLSIREHRFPFLEKVNDWNRFNRYSGGTFVEKCCHFFDLMRFILKSEPTSIMSSAAQSHNHLDERYNGETPDIIDNGFAVVNFTNGSRALLELCMFAEGSRYQEEICAVGKLGKIECKIPGPTRFWAEHLGPPPVAKLVISPRNPSGPVEIEIPVDPELTAAGDHHGSTFYQHRKFQQVVLGNAVPDVTLEDGWRAVKMGMAAQQSALQQKALKLDFTDTGEP
ncbi:oxidoreductase [Chromatiales bacterium (ex Bugula neritina AB1)]|nr:oxidoreductase [Chromatiales bacterium (ex Bugula neritina AB1)]